MKLSTRHSLLITALITGLTAFGCGRAEEDSEVSVSEMEAVVESGISAVSGTVDDQQNSSFARLTSPVRQNWYEQLQNELMPQAFAATCVRAAASACSSGVRAASYSGCEGANGLASFDGNVTLTYSDNSCALSANGDTVTRTYDVSITGPRGGVIQSTSDAQQNYLGASISGGGRLAKTVAGWNLEILGKNKSFTRGGRTLFDVSAKTTSPIAVTGSLARSSRVLNGGALEIYHNIAEFTTTVVPSNVTYSSACCYPVSGSLSVSFAGSKSGSGTITFNGCGSATFDNGSESEDLVLAYCE